ncbi:MAG: glutathione binding-like protein [bacterium]
MRISDESARRSQARLEEVLKNLVSSEEKEFLVGNSFTRADLTAASLLAPLRASPPFHDFTSPRCKQCWAPRRIPKGPSGGSLL